jgi:hypothetical protein
LKLCGVCGTAKYCDGDCQKSAWSSHKADCTKVGCLQLIAAVGREDGATVARFAKTKRILNGKVDFTPPATEEMQTPPRKLGKWTALHECVQTDKVDMMKLLMDNGAKLEIQDADGETPVFMASTCRYPKLIKVLLNAGANPNAQARDGWSGLMMAARASDYKTCNALLDGGASVSLGCDMIGRTALDIVELMAGGQGTRMAKGECFEEACEKYKRLHALLLGYPDHVFCNGGCGDQKKHSQQQFLVPNNQDKRTTPVPTTSIDPSTGPSQNSLLVLQPRYIEGSLALASYMSQRTL